MDDQQQEQDKRNASIRTFYRDIVKLETQFQQSGLLSSITREQNMARSYARELVRRRRASVVWVVFGLTLTLIGVASVVWVETIITPTPITSGPQLPSLFRVDYNLKLPLNDNPEARLASLAGETYISPSLVRIVPEHGSIATIRETSGVLFPNMPLSLTLANTPEFVMGFHTANNQSEPFLVMGIANFAEARAGIQEWEPTMAQDLSLLFGFTSDNLTGSFQHQLVNNLSVRAFQASTIIEEEEVFQIPIIGATNTSATENIIRTTRPGEPDRLFFYTILNAQYIIITTNPATLDEIILRLAQA